ncbi:DUF6973 domain-containing protein [Paucihalobacter sp.]|uniref:DUF6973 domain-containing protein n=1 Tax=Paucihalobacter sp. TaxID=2850405 RepID=UPI002FE1050F
MTEASNEQLQEIANFLNAHMFRIRNEFPDLDGFEPEGSNTSSTGYAISTYIRNFLIIGINALLNDGEVDFDEYLIYNPALDEDYLNRMAVQEREIYNGLNLNQKKHYLMSAQQATHFTQIYYPESLWNGKGDAFRHGLWNALATTRLGIDLTQQLTTAHESDSLDPNYDNHFKEKEMDLFNNEIGSLHSNNLVNIMLINMEQGTLRYLNNLTNGSSGMATNASTLIPTNQ